VCLGGGLVLPRLRGPLLRPVGYEGFMQAVVGFALVEPRSFVVSHICLLSVQVLVAPGLFIVIRCSLLTMLIIRLLA